jgi:hypothetical protein
MLVIFFISISFIFGAGLMHLLLERMPKLIATLGKYFDSIVMHALSHTSLHAMFIGPVVLKLEWIPRTTSTATFLLGVVIWPIVFFVLGVTLSKLAHVQEIQHGK